jgi:hypothetical protein
LAELIFTKHLAKLDDISAVLGDKLAVVPSILGIVLVERDEITVARVGAVEIAIFNATGDRLLYLRSGFQLVNSPQFKCGVSEYPRLSPTKAERVARGHLCVDDDEEVAPVSIPLADGSAWLVIASAICFHTISADKMRTIIAERANPDLIAVDIRNRAVATNYDGNVSVAVVSLERA